MQAWLTRFGAGDGKPRSATVVIRAYGVLAAILDVAVRDRRISSNPARGVKLPRKAKKKRAYLTPGQVELLAGGVSIAIVSKRLGHSTIAVTSDLYSHLLTDANRAAADAAEAMLPPKTSAPAHTLHTREARE